MCVWGGGRLCFHCVSLFLKFHFLRIIQPFLRICTQNQSDTFQAQDWLNSLHVKHVTHQRYTGGYVHKHTHTGYRCVLDLHF